jgi:hypothetical protein
MRALSKEYDYPDGVMEPEFAAAEIIRDLRAQAAREAFRQKNPPRDLLPEGEGRRRARPLAAARGGDARAKATLERVYRVRLILPTPVAPPPPAPAEPTDRRCVCGKPSRYKDGRCKTCYSRDWKRAHGARPRFSGPCRCGGGRPGRGGSGYANGCYRRRFYRQRALRRQWAALTGDPQTPEQVQVELLGLSGTPSQHEALEAVTRLLQALERGDALLQRNPWRSRRGG